MIPGPTLRLRFREMREDDLDDIAALLSDPDVMRYYPAPKTRADAQQWISRNIDRYRDHGFGLWIVETHEDEFVGDCGLTWQEVDGVRNVEVGYHVRTALQGRGFATEAAAACRDAAQAAGVERLPANVRADNLPSQRVAHKIGLTEWKHTRAHGHDLIVFGRILS